MAKIRKRAKFTWFPTLGTDLDQDDAFTFAGRRFTVAAGTTGQTTTIISPLTYDAPVDPGDTSADVPGSLVGIIGQEYFLRRIVGKIHLELQPGRQVNDDPSSHNAVLVGAGFFIARANDQESGGGQNTPIGSASAQELQDNYCVLAAETIREPWIWRRTWVLGNDANLARFHGIAEANGAVQYLKGSTFPSNNAMYGSVYDGPHIDAKTARRVKLDERLWFAVSVCHWPPANILVDVGREVEGTLDYRLLGQLRKASNRGVF